MSVETFRKRTAALRIPESIIEICMDIVLACEACQKHRHVSQRSRISGMRAEQFRGLVFVDHVDINVGQKNYTVLIVTDGATNFPGAKCQKTKLHDETFKHMSQIFDEWNLWPKAMVSDSYFTASRLLRSSMEYFGTQLIELGPHTPWPNKAGAAVKLFNKHAQILLATIQKLAESSPVKKLRTRGIFNRDVWARSTSAAHSNRTPLDIAFGRAPPSVNSVDGLGPGQLGVDPE